VEKLKLNIEKYKNQLPSLNINAIKSLIKAILDERKHNRKISENDFKNLKELEKKAEEELKKRKFLNDKTKSDYDSWKKKMENGKRCY